MQRFLTIFVLLAFSLNILPKYTPVKAQERWIRITSPNGGESFKEGDTVTITWDSSDNIDKVSIGYSTGPGSLSWIAFTAPNTKSYSWYVDVGNTTNTQFLIDITGWQTGTGSTNDKSDNYFTVTQRQEYPPTPTRAPYPTTSYQPPTYATPLPYPTNYKTRFIPPPVIYQNTYLTITNINIWTVFYFDGSQSTILKDVADPKHVKDFTLDTQFEYKFLFTQELDLTNQNNLRALSNLKNNWVIEDWFFWIKAEWWTTYKLAVPIEVKLKDKKLTKSPPKIIDELANDKTNKVQQKSNYTLTTNETGNSIKVEGPAKLKIAPQITLDGGTQINTSNINHLLSGKSSHKDLNYFIKINGNEQKPLALDSFNGDTGEFKAKLNNLTLGANFVQLYITEKADDTPVLVAEQTINYKPSIWEKIFPLLKILLLVGSSILFGFFINKIFFSRKILHKKHKK